MNLKLFALTATLVTTTMVSCKKEEAAPQPQNVVDIVSTSANFSLLSQAITRAGIATTLRNSTNITVFAPDNDAFAAAGINAAAINSLSADTLAKILQYHVLATNVGSANVPVSDAVPTLFGRNLYASRNANGVFVNGVRVKQADVAAGNGTIHVISRLLVPPTRTIAEVVSTNPDFSTLLAAVIRANLATAVSGAGKFTVFAPTNAAFTAAGFANAAAINAADQTVITTVVRNHVLTTNVFASDLINNSTVATLQGGTLTIGTTPPAIRLTGTTNPASNVATADIVATNGVIHVIDRVIR